MNKDDPDLFAKHMSGVSRKTNDVTSPYHKRPQAVPSQTLKQQRQVIDELNHLEMDDSHIETGDELNFHQPGIQHRVLRKLRKGEFSISAELDLHGLTSLQAKSRLTDFLAHANRETQTCVRIIHGKGLSSPGKKPVLKRKVATWLTKRKDVLAFCQAPRHDGGSGAIYVLLAKHQKAKI